MPVKIIRSSFNKLIDHKKLREDIPRPNFDGFTNEHLPGVQPGEPFECPNTLGVETISITAPQEFEDNEQLVESSVAELTTIFNQPANDPSTTVPRTKILCTTDRDVRHDLEMDESPPINLLHEYANEYILQMSY